MMAILHTEWFALQEKSLWCLRSYLVAVKNGWIACQNVCGQCSAFYLSFQLPIYIFVCVLCKDSVLTDSLIFLIIVYLPNKQLIVSTQMQHQQI